MKSIKLKSTRKPGCGRKGHYKEKTTTVSFRVPESHKPNVQGIVNDYLKPLKNAK